MRRFIYLVLLAGVATSQAGAVIVRGKVSSPLGVPLPGARVQLIQGQRSVADAISGADGAYEIRIDLAGRFVLLTAPSMLSVDYAPQVGEPFYAGRTDIVAMDIVLNGAGITPQISSEATLVATPLRRLATPLTQLLADRFLTQTSLIPELQTTSDAEVLQQGQTGAPAVLYVRGAPPETLQTTVDGVTANDLGSSFNLSTLSTAGLNSSSPEATLEVAPSPNPLYFVGDSGGFLALSPAYAQTGRPTLTYSGDAGGLGAYRNEAVATFTHGRFDLLGAFSRFDTANDLPVAPYHLVTWATNGGYHISAGTSLRFTAREDLSAAALTSPYEFYLIAPQGREAHQNIFGSASFDTRTAGGWHNLLRYGLARKRGESFDYITPAAGLPVTLRGANGYMASGTAIFDPLPPREDRVTGRDEAGWQSDYSIRPWLNLVGEVRFQEEHAADILVGGKQSLGRAHISAALGLQGDIRNRLFYEASGFLDHTTLLGFTGAPRLGLTYAPVRPGARKFRGTSLHVTAATGVREPSLLEEAANPEGLQSPRSRVLDASVDQTILARKLTLRATYFHSQFSHEFEPVALSAIASQPQLSQTLALRTQGFESDLRYQPYPRVLLEGGYSYLAALTERSAMVPSFNPKLPEEAIGGLSALAGQRPFHRPPQSGFFVAEYSGPRLYATLKGALVSASDDSTNLVQTAGLLLPNRNLSPGYASLDVSASLVLTRHVTVFSQLTNLTDNRHIAPIGFVSTPFLIRTGLRIRIGGE